MLSRAEYNELGSLQYKRQREADLKRVRDDPNATEAEQRAAFRAWVGNDLPFETQKVDVQELWSWLNAWRVLGNSERVALLALLPEEAKHFLDHVSAEVYANYEAFRAKKREIGFTIDPETAEIKIAYADSDNDPYGSGFDFLYGCCEGGRPRLFVRAPGAETWVFEDDLPEATLQLIKARYRDQLRHT
jgi:hypothetical protein